jgi:hypothetical protein
VIVLTLWQGDKAGYQGDDCLFALAGEGGYLSVFRIGRQTMVRFEILLWTSDADLTPALEPKARIRASFKLVHNSRTGILSDKRGKIYEYFRVHETRGTSRGAVRPHSPTERGILYCRLLSCGVIPEQKPYKAFHITINPVLSPSSFA